MGVKYKSKVNKLPEVAESLETMNGRKVIVGALRGENAWLAGIHEYGCRIPVTDKMRAFMHYRGIHLKKSTTVIVIPERSFIRTGHDENIDKVMKQTDRAISAVVAGTMSVDDMLDLCGEQLATAIKEYARELSSPPNSSLTTEWKGSSNPLVDTGNMIASIDWKVE